MGDRKTQLQRIKNTKDFSVLIIGAGINGIGTFRDLAFQGVDVLMVDRGDYCSGASAASSQMVHGGIRYLENGEFRLVREAVGERNRLIENAPHLVKPLPTTFPLFKIFSGLLNAPLKFMGLLDRPAERGALVIKIGMMFYDYFTRKQQTVPRHEFMNRDESLSKFPKLNPRIKYTGTYFDGAMPSPERIAVELVGDAVSESENAIPLNYVSFVSAKADTVVLRDELSGETFEVRPKIVVNAGGPWIDLVNRAMGKQTEFIRGTKGSHLVLDHPELRAAMGENEFFFENKDGRIVLIFPLHDKVLIGTSDLDIDDPDQAVLTNEEAQYFFEMVGIVFPDIKLDKSQIVFTFSGVRPLTNSDSKSSAQISRDHKIDVVEAGDGLEFPVYSLIGGKWTSFRAFSEQAADKVLNKLGVERVVSTEDMKIGGANELPEDGEELQKFVFSLLEQYLIPGERAESLVDMYGSRAADILQVEYEKMLIEYPKMSMGEVKYLVQSEGVVHLDDLIFRRTMIGKLGMLTEAGLSELAGICADVLGWDQIRMGKEIERVVQIMEMKHRMRFNQFIE
jgi:glycerol-3-phosphate dehydrogenase